MRVVIAVVVAAAGVTLHGCGGGGSPTPSPTTATTSTTSLGPPAPPAPPAPMGDIRPIRAITYGALPDRNAKPTDPLPARDLMQEGYEAQWSSDGRDDLGLIKTLGGNAVRLDHSLGLETQKDHGAFLDQAEKVGLHTIPGYLTQMLCDDFDCFNSWKAATLAGFGKGFMKNQSWHPSVAMLVLQEEPDELNFMGSTIADCKNSTVPGLATDNRCWLRAVFSAMDGVLAAEREKGMVHTNLTSFNLPNFTVAWSSAARDSIDGTIKNAIGYYGFYDVMVGVQNVSHFSGYTPRTSQEELADAFATRWTHGISVQSDWTFISGKITPVYKQFEPTPWFIAGFATNSVEAATMESDLQAMEAAGDSFAGVSLHSFQKEYQMQGAENGLFELGAATTQMPQTGDVCEEDPRTHHQTCNKFTVNCLQQQLGHGVNRAAAVASVWKGEVKGPGVCRSAVAKDIVV